jgi:membrane fusion protein, multidrug efflux system
LDDAVEKEVPSNKRTVIALAALVAFALVLAAILAYAFELNERSTDDAYVTGHLHTISARVSGTVTRVMVDDNQFVHAGDVLVQLDPRDFDVRVALEQSRLEEALSEQARARALMDQAAAAIESSTADARKSELDFARARELTGETPRGLSQQEFDAADAARTSARARVREATAQLAVSKAGLSSALALEAQGHANVHDASLQLSYTDVIAPTDGFVGKKTVETGERIVPGEALLTVVEPYVWVVANFRETQLRSVKVGDPVEIHVDALGDLRLRGHVDSFAPATGAQFALLPPDNATGNFTKVVQRVPVKILFDDVPAAVRQLSPGLSVTVKLSSRDAAK